MTSRKKSFRMYYCVVSENTVVCKYGSNTSKTLLVGSLVLVDFKINDQKYCIKVVECDGLFDESLEQYHWECPAERLLPIDEVVWPLLEAVSSLQDRVKILKNETLCKELCSIEPGTIVHIYCNGGSRLCAPKAAVVKYKGPVAKKGPGTYFGVEFLETESREYCDGSFAGQKYFTCPPRTGMFVTVNDIEPASTPEPLPMVSRHSTSQYQSSSSIWPDNESTKHRSINSDSISKFGDVPLKRGDEVIWVTEDTHLRGVVRKLKLESEGQIKVAVCLDDLLHKLEEHHRVVEIPAVELVKAEDFYGTSTETKKSKQRTKSESGIICSESNGKLRRSDSLHWTNVAADSEDSYDFLLNNYSHNSRTKQSCGDLMKLSTSPEDTVVSGSSSSDYDTPEGQGQDLGVGSVVEVRVDDQPLYGVIRWIGTIHGDRPARRVAGIEMEEEHEGCNDGTFNGRRYFTCNPHRAYFVALSQCRKDSRFLDAQPVEVEIKTKEFGGVDCPPIPGTVQPLSCRTSDVESLCGKYRGIQGHHNSCYLDATLFSMFAFTSVFDALLFRPGTEKDIDRYEEVQAVLREEIVNPLREKLFVRADRVMKLRTLLETLSSVTGLTCEEKDPEEFLTSLVAQILRAQPFLQLSSGQEAYHYQLFVEKNEHLTLPTVQQLFEQSFLSSDIKLKEVPSCLIIQMPRFGKSFKMYPRILPSQLLDITDVIENSPRQCTVCGKLAQYECKECFDHGISEEGLQNIAFCPQCLNKAHSHQQRSRHKYQRLQVPTEFVILQDHCTIPRLYMELFAVVCIETSHYVAFVKCGTGSEAPWCFFDSMADRKGEQNGYNIPEVVACPNLPVWLTEKGAANLNTVKDDRLLPEHAKRLLCDAYMCMYQSSEVSMYR